MFRQNLRHPEKKRKGGAKEGYTCRPVVCASKDLSFEQNNNKQQLLAPLEKFTQSLRNYIKKALVPVYIVRSSVPWIEKRSFSEFS